MNVQQKWKTSLPWVIGVAGAMVVVLIYMVFSQINSPANRVRRAIQLGERYLLEEKYEQAIIQFSNAIEIANSDPSIIYLADEAQEKLDTAIQTGAAAQIQAPGGDINDAVDWIDQVGCTDEPAADIFKDAQTLLTRMQELCVDEDYEAMFQILSDKNYKETVSGIMGLECSMRLIDDTTDMLTAVYRMEVDTENFAEEENASSSEPPEAEQDEQEDEKKPDDTNTNYMVYYGEHDGDLRSGHGVWLAFQNGNNYLAQGEWEEDVPNGRFETRSWQADLNTTVTYRIITGNVRKGLWDGRVSWQFEREDVTDEYTPSFEQGIWKILREEDGLAIAADNGNGNRLVVTEPEKTNGIAGYAQAA